jgi:hypothetical protein
VEVPSWALERVRRYGVAGLFPGAEKELPFILYAESVPRPAWSGKRDFQRERLYEVYTFLTGAVTEATRSPWYVPVSPGTPKTLVSQREALKEGIPERWEVVESSGCTG